MQLGGAGEGEGVGGGLAGPLGVGRGPLALAGGEQVAGHELGVGPAELQGGVGEQAVELARALGRQGPDDQGAAAVVQRLDAGRVVAAAELDQPRGVQAGQAGVDVGRVAEGPREQAGRQRGAGGGHQLERGAVARREVVDPRLETCLEGQGLGVSLARSAWVSSWTSASSTYESPRASSAIAAAHGSGGRPAATSRARAAAWASRSSRRPTSRRATWSSGSTRSCRRSNSWRTSGEPGHSVW
ncbi:hypothetical protein [Nannocystis pusilla]|uniref:hypothetical protein n=1 Tax=Nannocystis pusilla TaxID=889268 RepID=UPI003B80B174